MNPNLKYYEYTPKDLEDLTRVFSFVFRPSQYCTIPDFITGQGILKTLGDVIGDEGNARVLEELHTFIASFLYDKIREFGALAAYQETERRQHSECLDQLKGIYDPISNKQPKYPFSVPIEPRDNSSPRAG